MTKEAMYQLKNGWGRVIVTIVFSGLAAWGGANFALGQYKEKIDTNRELIERVQTHGSDQIASIKERLAAVESRYQNLERTLERIESKIDAIHQRR